MLMAEADTESETEDEDMMIEKAKGIEIARVEE